MKIEERTLIEALEYAKKMDLPDVYDPSKGQPWVFAILHVTKINGIKNYVIARNDGNGNPEIIKDFGEPARVARVNSIHPYIMLSGVGF